MPSFRAPLRRVGRLLAHHVGRLRVALERLAAEVRAAVARAVGPATREAVREALAVVLDRPPERPSYERLDDRGGGWSPLRRPTWPTTRPYDPYQRDPYEPDTDAPDDEPVGRYADDDDPPAEEPAVAQRRGAWSRAVAAGCQAAAWWLRRHPGPLALVAAARIGVTAGMATLAGSPLLAGASTVAASALGLLALADAACSGAGLADQALN
jgi:hypothetical protein